MKNISRRKFLGLTAAGAAALTFPGFGCASQKSKERPNFMVIMADDMGYSDAGCYGGEINTPNLDKMANNGLRFDNFYNCARCCPTRASLLTGQYPHSVNMATMANDGYSLGRNGVTIAEALKEAGYQTSMYGKWHLSEYDILDDEQKQQQWLNHQYDPGVPFSNPDTYPTKRGFDDFYGVILGVIDYYDPYSLMDGDKKVEDVPDDFYFTDAITDRANNKIREYGEQDDPFFMYVAHAASHWPLQVPGKEADKYEETYDNGWDEIRKQRFRRQVEMGLFSDDVTLPPVQTDGMAWDSLSEERKEFMADKMAAHAGMVDRMDQNIGRLISTLEETGQLDNTVILFLSDNGASPETPKDWGPGLDRPSETRDGEKVRYEGFKEAGPETTFAGVGPAWANTANSPFRYWKAENYEGGAHTPCIVHWPAGLKVKAGSANRKKAHVMDVLPTFLELADASYPKKYNGSEITPMAGKSLTPILADTSFNPHRNLFFEHMGARAVISEDDWKIVATKKDHKEWNLYNLKEDPTETKNLAVKHPHKVKAMNEAWKNWAYEVGMDEYPMLKKMHDLDRVSNSAG